MSTRLRAADRPNAYNDDNDTFIHSQDSHIISSIGYNDEPSLLDERAMRRELMDIESSFIPDQPSPRLKQSVPDYGSRPQVHSTGLPQSSFSSPTKSKHQLSPAKSSVSNGQYPHSANLAGFPSRARSTHASPARLQPKGLSNNQRASFSEGQPVFRVTASSSSDTPNDPFMFSSPAAAASQRNQARMAPANVLQPAFGDSLVSEMHASQEALFDDPEDEAAGMAQDPTPISRDVRQLPQDDHRDAFERKAPDAADDSTLLDESLRESEQSRKSLRPAHLSKRQSSYRSSASSWMSRNAPGEDSQSVAETHESGGATPGPGRANELSRIPSLGSIASSISHNDSSFEGPHKNHLDSTTQMRAGEVVLDPVVEEKSSPTELSPKTPTVRQDPVLTAPTNTVLNDHVKDAPGTAGAKNQHQNIQGQRPQSSQETTPFFGRTRGNLTLKEQNSKIDKLSKENFDLKLKIHYLTQALQDRSDEGVKDLVTRNAQLQTDLIKSKKETQNLKKRTKELERLAGYRQGPSTTPSRYEESEGESSREYHQNQFEEELGYLRDRIQHLETENDKLNQDSVTREFEKRRLAEQIRSLDTGSNSKQEDTLKGLLEAESSRREQVEQQLKSARSELAKLRAKSPIRLRRQPSIDPLSPGSHLRQAQTIHSDDAATVSGSTLVEQLRQENSDLKRDLGAQTSMLTSRNRERERLQEEIESLKLMHRRGEGPRSIAGDSILDRSVSRSNLQRPVSRGGASSRQSGMSEADRDHYEAIQAALRDENSYLRMRNQDLQKDLDYLTDGAEHIEALRAERDEALRLGDEDRDYAATAIDNLEMQLEEKISEVERITIELANKEVEAEALQHEIRQIGDSLNRVVDDAENSQGTIQALQEDLTNATGEIEALEQSLRDAVGEKERLEVQAESSQGEISFLRDEQESDKIRISDLENALRNAKFAAAKGQEKITEFEKLQEDLGLARDEARSLRKGIEAARTESSKSRDKLQSFEKRVREATRNFDADESSLLLSIAYMKEDIEHLTKELNKRTHQLEVREAEFDDVAYQLQARETELRTHQQASREFKDALDRERRDRKNDQEAHARTVSTLNQRAIANGNLHRQPVSEDSSAVAERNELILSAYQRLAALCGVDWGKRHNIRSLTMDDLARSLTAVDDPLDLMISAVEKTLSSFRARLRNAERDISRDFTSLEAALNSRSRRLEALEKQIKAGAAGSPIDATNAEIQRLKQENKSLYKELQFLKEGAFALPGLPAPSEDLHAASVAAQAVERERNASSGKNGSSSRRPASASASNASRDVDTTALARFSRSDQVAHVDGSYDDVSSARTSQANSDARYLLQMKELERRLKSEREGRLLDRTGARKRLEESEKEREELRRELERMRGFQSIGAITSTPSAAASPSGRRSPSSAWKTNSRA